jgi:5,5'-dehydrodivanillate O-demethylase
VGDSEKSVVSMEPDGGKNRDRVMQPWYPLQERYGLVWAYMGPQPAPLLPRWEQMVWDNAVREICIAELPCNWLQCQENSLDPVHSEWLHGHWGNFIAKWRGEPERIKRVLCENATDLGRERYFQGSGMLDVLRASTRSADHLPPDLAAILPRPQNRTQHSPDLAGRRILVRIQVRMFDAVEQEPA